ncbi:hypothetical protein BO78DRAFT_469058 [Aspergillus sclerotiicarbonarius CBS 121057]|uniref:Heterokaryon incompatibility domain-containing protein n=1 Tax=Aspergillus sclerotiicarbonarius (strain CBS 121057 / IBT 28362) TaxID=1448318 RepID=A0A319EJ71_ASPSB|nr:hypothetical protein BO78DRAFT_469058 [Aspergillus sclerotiicarbonarius CBS 121057]
MFRHKLERPSLRDGHRSEKQPVVSIMTDADDDSAATGHPSGAEEAPQRINILGDLRDAALSSSLVANVRDLKVSAANEVAKVNAIVTKDGSSRDEKLRTLLHQLVRSRREASLYNDFADMTTTEDSDLQLGSFAAQLNEISVPLRMIDMDTMNMVDTGDFGEEDQYCMLSHSWKGGEVDYAFVCEAQRAERAPGSNDSDVTAVLNLCNSKIEKIAVQLDTLLQKRSDPEQSIRKLLVKSLRASMLERALATTKKGRTIADANKRQSDLEQNNYRKLLAFLGETRTINSLGKRKADAEDQQNKASREWNSAEQDYGAAKSEIMDFRSDRQLSYAIDDLLRALQQRRSARKLERSINRAREVYDTRPFSKTGRRYIWLDNCCIDKRQAAELSESLARMGEWYANADFCLVHLDTKWDNREWLDEWDSWCETQSEVSKVAQKYNEADSDHSDDDKQVVSADENATPRCQPVVHFEEIKEWKPTWATRGWTLQELVLSKMTFYVNADWKWLPRPIDVLGIYYHFCPFVDFYTRNLRHVQDWKHRDIGAELTEAGTHEGLDEVTASENREEIRGAEIKTATPGEDKERINVNSIIRALELFKYVAPKQLDKETARAQISYSVQVAAKATIDQSINEHPNYHQARERITETLFAEVPREELYADVSRSTRVKQTIDRLLGALAETANERIRQDRQSIASFSNVEGLSSWTDGTQRDRFSAHSVITLASHRECTKAIDKAYSLMGILGVQFPAFPAEGLIKALSRLLDEVVVTSHDVSVFNWTGKYNGSPLRGRSLYASNIEAFQAEGEGNQARPDVNGELVRLFRDDRIKRLKVAQGVTQLLLDATKFVTAFQQAEATVDALLKLVEFIRTERLESLKRRLGSSALLGIMQKAGIFAQQEEELEKARKEQGKAKQDASSHQTTEATESEKKKNRGRFIPALPKGSSRGDGAAEDTEKQEEDKARDDRLAELGEQIQSSIPTAMKGDVPCADENNAFHAIKIQSSTSTTSRGYPRDRPIICPNPIVVNSSGIKGVFDIQRVVVKLLQPDELRTKVRNAVSDGEKIDGWCTISTGFALTMVAFSCERHILSSQLDLGDVIDQTVLEEPEAHNIEAGDTHQQQSGPGGVPNKPPNTKDLPSSATGGSPTEKPPGPKRSPSSLQDSDSPESESQPKLDNYGQSLEQRRVSRMIDFVAESNLHAIAGEWVLARFSGAIGAKWFLCRLELGSGNEFYARRIATDEIDFANAVPEKGLVEFWNSFLHKKKLTMCDMLQHYLDAQKAGNYATWLHNNLQETFGLQKMGESGDEEDEANKDPKNYGSLTSTGKLFKMIGWGLRYAFDELWARHLESHLEESALANVPPILHAAIKDLGANKTLLPVMFHSGRDVHFF